MLLLTLACVSPQPDCALPGPSLQHAGEDWEAKLTLPLREGRLREAGLQIMINEGDQIADCASTGGAILWEVEGSLGEAIRYSQLPAGAEQHMPLSGEPDALLPSRAYTVEFWILDDYEDRLSCPSWRLVWVQDQEESVVSCD